MAQPQTQQKTYFDPHGYFFVSLPNTVERRPLTDIPRHGPSSGTNLLSGALTCHLICITPVHIGSGSYRHDPNAPGKVVADTVRDSQGNPIIPGSSLKGSFRAISEAASKSCLLLRQTQYEEQRRELPDAVVAQLQQAASRTNKRIPGNVAVQVRAGSIEACRVPSTEEEPRQQGIRLCPCCAVFGTLLYRGRINLSNATLVGQHRPQSNTATQDFVRIPARYGGRVHRLARSGSLQIMETDEEVGLEIRQPLGRRFYPNWDPHGLFATGDFDWTALDARLPNRTVLNQNLFSSSIAHQVQWQQNRFIEPHAVIPIGSVLQFRLHFTALREYELGMLLTALGLSANYWWLPKLGGAKAHGLGTVLIVPEQLRLEREMWWSLTGDAEVIAGEPLRERVKHYTRTFEESSAFHWNAATDLHVGLSLDLSNEISSGRVEVMSY